MTKRVRGGRRRQSRRWVHGVGFDKKNRHKWDYYPTEPIAVELLLQHEDFPGGIWEPACGDGAIVRVLRRAGASVHASDLYRNGTIPRGAKIGVDFLAQEKMPPATRHIITNPPFKIALPFMRKALELAPGKVAMLARLASLEGEQRYLKLFRDTPPAFVYVFVKRLHMWRGRKATRKDGGSMIAFMWLVWHKDYAGEPRVRWLYVPRK